MSDVTPYEEGQFAARQGKPYWECPYTYGTIECQDWIDGWRDVNLDRPD